MHGSLAAFRTSWTVGLAVVLAAILEACTPSAVSVQINPGAEFYFNDDSDMQAPKKNKG